VFLAPLKSEAFAGSATHANLSKAGSVERQCSWSPCWPGWDMTHFKQMRHFVTFLFVLHAQFLVPGYFVYFLCRREGTCATEWLQHVGVLLCWARLWEFLCSRTMAPRDTLWQGFDRRPLFSQNNNASHETSERTRQKFTMTVSCLLLRYGITPLGLTKVIYEANELESLVSQI